MKTNGMTNHQESLRGRVIKSPGWTKPHGAMWVALECAIVALKSETHSNLTGGRSPESTIILSNGFYHKMMNNRTSRQSSPDHSIANIDHVAPVLP
ncbi:hypothetical protein PoB_000612600 [Plakobranchus ocellatus]|uniref:Uncharacterized protein n=1 Tax=Plakobranchus ocellatus TaxID=259542 RepID=A0AAV3Y8S5_9GAST|nr:hypothetical protein PoB_000612600 [Plakobranchus ocellatus]